MAKRLGALSGKSAKRVGIALVVLAALIALPAIARAVTIDTGGEVFSDKCTACHANYNLTDNPNYAFTHGNHITYQCSTCHPTFPHTPMGTDLPDMKQCWNCHGLRHGPQGVIATGVCADCHGNRVEAMRPVSHNANWAKEPHVVPANEGLTTECSMCHTRSQCDACHAATGVFWNDKTPMVYDAGSGCLACHGSPNLIKTSGLGIKSFQVVGLDASAHRDLACPDCHVDFAYADVETESNVWYVNAGLSCGKVDCHGTDDPATAENEDYVTAYQASVHGTKLAEGDIASATCGSCHGSHAIRRLDTAAARRALQMSGKDMCMSCHQDRWDNYNDSYHGAAYKRGAEDAPACWDCHAAHEILPSNDPASATNDAKLAATCGGSASGDGCHQHKNASEAFVTQTSGMIHKTSETRATNPIFKLLPMLRRTSSEDGSS